MTIKNEEKNIPIPAFWKIANTYSRFKDLPQQRRGNNVGQTKKNIDWTLKQIGNDCIFRVVTQFLSLDSPHYTSFF